MSVINLNDLKEHLRVTISDDDALLTEKLDAAESHLEKFTGRAFLTQTRTIHFDGFCRSLELPVSPVQSITSVKYLDQNLVEQTLSADSYLATPLNSDDPTYLYPADGTSWPSTARVRSAVTVTLQAGYGTADDVPAPLCEAIKQLAAHWYENREAVLIGTQAFALPLSLFDLVGPYRAWVF